MVFSHSSSRSEHNIFPDVTIRVVHSSLRSPAFGRNFLPVSTPTRSPQHAATNTGKKSSRADKLTSRGHVFTSGNLVPSLKSIAKNMNLSQMNKNASPSRQVSRAQSAQASFVRGSYQNAREQPDCILTAEDDKRTRLPSSSAPCRKPPCRPFSRHLSHLHSSDQQLPQHRTLVRETGSNLKSQIQSLDMFVSNREIPCPIYPHSCPDVVSCPRMIRRKTSPVLLETKESKPSPRDGQLSLTRHARRPAGSSSRHKTYGRSPRSKSSEAVRSSNRGLRLNSWALVGGHQSVSSSPEEDLAIMRESVRRSPIHSIKRLASDDDWCTKARHRLLPGQKEFSSSCLFNTRSRPFWVSGKAEKDDETITATAREGVDPCSTRLLVDTEDSCTPTNTRGAWSPLSLDGCSQRTSLDCAWESVNHVVPRPTASSSSATVCLSQEHILPHISCGSCCSKCNLQSCMCKELTQSCCCKEPMTTGRCREPIQSGCSKDSMQSCNSKEPIESFCCGELNQSLCSKEIIDSCCKKEPINYFFSKEPIHSFSSKHAIKSCRSVDLITACCNRESIPSDSSEEPIEPYCSESPIQSCFTKNPSEAIRPVQPPPLLKACLFSRSKDLSVLKHCSTSSSTSCSGRPKKTVANTIESLACSSLGPPLLATSFQRDKNLLKWSVCAKRSVSLPNVSFYPRDSPILADSQDMSLLLSPQEKHLLVHLLTKLSRLSELSSAGTDACTNASVGTINLHPSSSHGTTYMAYSVSNNLVARQQYSFYLMLVLVLTLCLYLAYIMTISYFYHQRLSS